MNEILRKLQPIGLFLLLSAVPSGVILANMSMAGSAIVRQNGDCKGVVKDANGETVIGASVKVKGVGTGSITDIDGNFMIPNVPHGATLEISFVGYQTATVTWEGKPLNTVLKEDARTLEEVVMVGFGSQKKANLTGAVTTVKMDDALGERPLTKAADVLQGAVPGLFVGSNGNFPGESRSFQIRGAYSIGSQSNVSPLVLIDNVEGDIDMLNPDDIESITVMKDAASCAIYGARAAGGVILVTTKRPQNEERFRLNYNNNFALANAVNLPEQTSLETYLHAYWEASGNDYWSLGTPKVDRWLELLARYKANPSSVEIKGDGIYKDTGGALYFLNEKNLMKNMMETGFQQIHNLSASGGTERLRYRLSAGLVDTDGVLYSDKDKYSRMNISSFISADIAKWFTQEAALSYAHSKRNMVVSQGGGLWSTRLVSYYPEGTMPEGYGLGPDANLPFFTFRNQIEMAQPYKDVDDNPRIFLKSILKPLKGFEIAFEYTYDKNTSDYHWHTGSVQMTSIQGGVDTTPGNDYLRKNKQYTDYNAINLYGTYSFDWVRDHHFKVMAGFNKESGYQETFDVYSRSQVISEGGSASFTVNDSYREYTIRGGFFRVNYDYKGRYLLEVNGRYDGSSKLPKNSRFSFSPSVSAGWNMTQEDFMAGTSSWLDQLKIRGSYGLMGNQNIPAYSFVPSIKVSTANIGIDFALFNNRLSGLFEWYRRDTRSMPVPGMQPPAVEGAFAPTQNMVDMRTRGWELNMNWCDKIGKWSYRVGFNLSDLKSVITKYDSNKSKSLSAYYEGMELGEYWGYLFDGFYTVADFADTRPGS